MVVKQLPVQSQSNEEMFSLQVQKEKRMASIVMSFANGLVNEPIGEEKLVELNAMAEDDVAKLKVKKKNVVLEEKG